MTPLIRLRVRHLRSRFLSLPKQRLVQLSLDGREKMED